MAARNRFRLARTKSRTFRERYVPDNGYTTIPHHTPPDFKDEVISLEVRKPDLKVHSWVSNLYPQNRLYRRWPVNTDYKWAGIGL
jgi:hypothetical protein